jgi:hypothetical protein
MSSTFISETFQKFMGINPYMGELGVAQPV